MAPARYQVREKPNDRSDAPREWGLFDTFCQEWVWGERYASLETATHRAATYNHAYERTL